MKEALKLYTTLTGNDLEKSVAKSLQEDVKASVQRAQSHADKVINALTKKGDPDLESARSNIMALLGAPAVIRDHWRPFSEEVLKLLPHEELDGVMVPPQAPPSSAEQLAERLDQQDHAIEGLRQQLDAAMARQGELDQANAKLRQQLADKEKEVSDAKEAVVKFNEQEQAARKRAGELEHELEALKKKSHSKR